MVSQAQIKWFVESLVSVGGGCHQLQLVLVVLFHAATSTDCPLAHAMVSPSATCTGRAFHPATGPKTALAHGQLYINNII